MSRKAQDSNKYRCTYRITPAVCFILVIYTCSMHKITLETVKINQVNLRHKSWIAFFGYFLSATNKWTYILIYFSNVIGVFHETEQPRPQLGALETEMSQPESQQKSFKWDDNHVKLLIEGYGQFKHLLKKEKQQKRMCSKKSVLTLMKLRKVK